MDKRSLATWPKETNRSWISGSVQWIPTLIFPLFGWNICSTNRVQGVGVGGKRDLRTQFCPQLHFSPRKDTDTTRIQIRRYRYMCTCVCLQLTCCGQLSSLERRSTVQVKRKCIFEVYFVLYTRPYLLPLGTYLFGSPGFRYRVTKCGKRERKK